MSRSRLAALLTALAAAWLAAAELAGCDRQPPLEVYQVGGDFHLTDQRGQPFDLAQRRGRVLLLFFGFVSCADICPATLSKLGQVLDRLPPPGAEVLFVTVDPARDTPERLAEYASGYAFPMIGLTGTRAQIAAVARQYGASFQPVADSSGGVDHSTHTYLIDAQGRVRYLFSSGDGVQEMAAVVGRLL